MGVVAVVQSFDSAALADLNTVLTTGNELSSTNMPADLDDVQQGVHRQLTTIKAIYSGAMSNASSVNVVTLDALNETMKDVDIRVYVPGATAGAGITVTWHTTTYTDPSTYVEQTVPSLGGQHDPTGAVIELYEVGDLARGLQGQLRMASAGDDSAMTYEATVTYLQ